MPDARESLLQDVRLTRAAEALALARDVFRDPEKPYNPRDRDELAFAMNFALDGLQAVRRGE